MVLCALINPVVNLKRTTYGMPSGLRGVLHCPFNFQPYSRYARWQARAEMCGNSRQQAMTWLIDLEMLTAP
ncbi:hypothetical protein K3P58_001036 [Escherichia coli]|nr:hypothetical protein [Escherichia coli]